MALGLSQKSVPVHNGLHKTPIVSKKSGGDLDFDLLVTHVESTIHEDKRHQRNGITPQELMMRSNPAIYQADNAGHRDLANPREVYNILSHKSKSIEDLAVKFKQELARSVQTTGSLPKLSRALSMNDIEHRPDKVNRLGHKNDSHGIMSNSHRKLNLLVLKRHNTSVNELHKTTEIKHELNLPSIEEKNARHEELKTKPRQRNELGQLTERTECDDINNDVGNKRVNFSDSKQHGLAEEKDQTSGQEAKLNKWFSEMPNEVFDKAQRALMEESIKDRLQDFQKRRRKKHTEFPHPSVHINVGPKVRRVPNTYLELRVDSFGKHIQNEKDDRIHKYKLQQKSMHHLKMREPTDIDQSERLRREETFPKLIIPSKSKPKKLDQEPAQIVLPKKEPTFHVDGGFKTVNINDAVGTDLAQNSKPKHGHNNYEEYTERLVMMKELTIDLTHLESRHDLHCGEDTEKDTNKAAIVNLTLEQELPNIRKPHHLEHVLSDTNMDIKLPSIRDDDADAEDKLEEGDTEEQLPIPDNKIITKIPTAQSTRTSDTRSSNSSILSKSNKEALKKFNKLEVFAESQPPNNYNVTRDHFSKGRHRAPDESKIETKQQKRFVQPNPDAILLQEVRKSEPDVIFRFEPGEVFVQRKHKQQMHTHTRSSERARIIYGKTLHGNNDKTFSDKQSRTSKKNDTKTGSSAVSKSTKLEGFKSEFRRYENRAKHDSLCTLSPRQDDGARNNAVMEERPAGLRLTRDVATETELLGSIKDSKSGVSAENKPIDFYKSNVLDDRPDSELSDFIVDNNDGESLESDGDDVSEPVHRVIKSTISL